jgi:hypothetical protein
MKKLLTKAIIAVFALSVIVQTPAEARPTNDLLKNLSAIGTGTSFDTTANLDFSGNVQITAIAYDSGTGALLVEGVLSGAVTADSETTPITSQTFTTSATLSFSGQGRTQLLTLDLGDVFLPLMDLTLDLEDLEINLGAARGNSRLLGNMLRQLTRMIERGAPATQIDRQTSRINNILGGFLKNIQVSGSTVDLASSATGTASGTVLLTELSVECENSSAPNNKGKGKGKGGNVSGTAVLSIGGTFSGTLSDGTVTTTVLSNDFDATVTISSNSLGGVQFDIGPFEFDGSEIDLEAFTLDLGTVGGSANLLANSLRQLIRAIDQGQPCRNIERLVSRVDDLLDD